MSRQSSVHASPEEEGSSQKDLFKDAETGFRIAFFIHKSIKKRSRRFLTEDIESRGGIVVDDDEGANTVLVAKDFPKADLQTAYNAHSNARFRKIFVEPSTFIERCINEDNFHHRKPQIKGMRGRPPGQRRVEFSKEDDQNLCRYLSVILPNKESGGRLGLNIYKSLITIAGHKPDEYQWALRHTPESWKQRYKRSAARFDRWIAEMAEADPGNEHPWPEDRQMTHKRLRRIRELDSDGEEFEEVQTSEIESEEEYVPAPSSKRPRSGRSHKRLRRIRELDSDGEEFEEVQTSESESEEEYIPAPSSKRPRSGRSSLPDIPPPKRVRTAPQVRRPSRPQRPSTTNKGKEKASEEGSDAEHAHEGTSLFSSGEGDLSGDFHDQPLVDTFAEDDHHTHPSPGQLTQDTLVGTSSREDPSKVASTFVERTRDSDRFPQPTEERIAPPSSSPRQHPRSTVYVDLRAPHMHQIRASQPQAQSSPRRALLEPPQPTPPMPPPAQPSNTYQRPQKAVRRPPELVEQGVRDPSGPYRNTRSRSLSVYPPPNIPPAATTHGKMKGKSKQTDLLPVEEDMLLVEESIAPLGETLADERDVEILLDMVNHEPSMIALSMESDDAQVARDLRDSSIASSRVAPAKGFSSLLIPPDEFLKQVGKSRTSHSRHPGLLNSFQVPFGRNSPVLPQTDVLHNQPRQSEPSGLGREIPSIFKTPDPYMPQQRVRKGPGSTSSSESFPLSGTRASAYKKTLRQLEKRSPYKPPAGTRAAELVINKR